MMNLRIREYRLQRGLTQVDLESLTGIAQSRISLYESGSVVPSIDVLIMVADALQCSLDDLTGRGKDE